MLDNLLQLIILVIFVIKSVLTETQAQLNSSIDFELLM